MTCPKINNRANLDIEPHQTLFNSFFPYSQKTLGYTDYPAVNFISDQENAAKPLGNTGYYDPSSKEITIYVDGRHIKDVLRSIAHELVHHAQNERGEFDRDFDTSPGYALEDGHLWDMEQEAYKDGNSCFRRWEDTYKQELRESKKMKSNKIQEMVRKELRKVLKEIEFKGKSPEARAREEKEAEMLKALRSTPRRRRGRTMEKEPWTGYQGRYDDFPSVAARPPTGTSGPSSRRKKLKVGNRNVRALQTQLRRINARGFGGAKVKVDGIAGPQTASALASVSAFPCIGQTCQGSVGKLKGAANLATQMLEDHPVMKTPDALDRLVKLDAERRAHVAGELPVTKAGLGQEVAAAADPSPERATATSARPKMALQTPAQMRANRAKRPTATPGPGATPEEEESEMQKAVAGALGVGTAGLEESTQPLHTKRAVRVLKKLMEKIKSK